MKPSGEGAAACYNGPMTKVVFAPLKTKGPVSVKKSRVRGPDGKLTTIFSIDANSPTFGDDIAYVFKKNVEKARRQNRELKNRESSRSKKRAAARA